MLSCQVEGTDFSSERREILDLLNPFVRILPDDLATQANLNFIQQHELSRAKDKEVQRLELAAKDQEQRIALIEAEAKAVVERFKAVSGPFGDVLATIGNQEALTKIAKAASLQTALMGDQTVADALGGIFGETTLGQVFKRISEKSIPALNGSGPVSQPLVDPAE